MDLRDRYEVRALWMAGVQLALLAGLIILGLLPLALGARMLIPGLVITAVFAALVWLTLHRPWTWDWGNHDSRPGKGGHYLMCDGALIVAMTAWVTHFFARTLVDGEERAEEMLGSTVSVWVDSAKVDAWREDTFGVLIVAEHSAFLVVALPLAALGLLWLFLPR